jgi:Terminase large subunit, T4likevirus-type, N-terminal/Terminase RNaseH-like domain
MSNPQDLRPAIGLMRKLGLEPDPWQAEVLEEDYHHLLLNCCRQAGKSTIVAMLGLARALFHPGSLVLLVSRSFRQSSELFRVVKNFHFRLGEPWLERRTNAQLELKNLSRIVCLPCSESTIRGFANVSLVVLDEAARVPDDLYLAVRPMIVVSGGRMVALSTPRGKRGFFYHAWTKGGADWKRIEVPASKIPRLHTELLEKDRRAMGETTYRQEYCCSFEALEGLVYPDLPRCVVPGPVPAFKRCYGGIDFGFRNPCAAVWGGVDRDGILWLTREHYVREEAPSWHAARLPREVTWFADPHGASEIAEFRKAGLNVRKGRATSVHNGIAAVQTRIRTGTLKIVDGACPNLLNEAGLYRWDDAPEDNRSEQPADGYDHALDALRYLIGRLDEGKPPVAVTPPPSPNTDPNAAPPPPPAKKRKPWLRYDNEALWTTIWP